MKKIVAIAILTATISTAATASAGLDPRFADITHCDTGSMVVTDHGWLVGPDGSKIDYHAILEDPYVSWIPDHVYHAGDEVRVCQDGNKVRFFATEK